MSDKTWKWLMEEAKKELARSDEIHGIQTDVEPLDMLLIVAEEAAEFNASVLRTVNVSAPRPSMKDYTELIQLLAMILKAGRNIEMFRHFVRLKEAIT